MVTERKWLSVGEAAARLGVCNETIRQYIAKGRLTARRLPTGQRRVQESDIEALLIDQHNK